MPTPTGYLTSLPVTINGGSASVSGSTSVASFTGTDYVVQLHLTGSQAASVYNGSNHNGASGFGDVAIFYSGTQIDVDVDQLTNGAWSTSNITLWFKLQATLGASPATDGNYTLAYGQASSGSPVTTKNNTDNVYPFCDYFPGSGINNSTKWDTTHNAGTLAVSGGQLSMSLTSGQSGYIQTKNTWGDGFIVSMYGKLCATTIGNYTEFDWRLPNTATGFQIYTNATVWSTNTGATLLTADTASHLYTIARTTSAGSVLSGIDGTTVSSSYLSGNYSPLLGVNASGANRSLTAQCVKVRPFVATEPVATAGTSYVASGPAIAVTRKPSAAFQVRGLGVTSSDTITLSDGGAGGTFIPSSLTLTSGAPTQTFTYTAAASAANTTATIAFLSSDTLPVSSLTVSILPYSRASMAMVASVRGPDTNGGSGGSGMYTATTGLLAAANGLNPFVPLTFSVRYDAVVDNAGGNVVSALATAKSQGHELSVWLEVTQTWCTAASVTYNTNGSTWYGSPRCTLLGYSQSDQRKLIDTLFSAFRTAFGAYPTSAGMWMVPAYAARYMRDTYGVACIYLCRDQWGTDAYTLEGGPENTIWESSNNWLMVPASDTTNRLGIAVIRCITTDILHNPGPSVTVYTLEPIAVQNNSKTIPGYWTPLVRDEAVLPSTNGPLTGFLCSFADNSASWSSYSAIFGQSLTQMNTYGAAGFLNLTTVTAAAKAFLALNPTTRDAKRFIAQSVDSYTGTATQCMYAMTPRYKARMRWLAGVGTSYLYLTDLRVFDPSYVDPYDSTICNTQMGTWRVPWVIDGTSYSTTTARNANDDPANSPLSARVTAYDLVAYPSGSNTSSDYSGTTPNATITVAKLPATLGDVLSWTREAGIGMGKMDFRTNGIIYTLSRTTQSSSALLYLEWGVVPASDPVTQIVNVGGTETTVDLTTNSVALSTYSTPQYLTFTFDNRDAALIFFPLTLTNATWYAATGSSSHPRFGCQATASSGTMGCSFAVVPCLKSTWRTTLAALQANATAFLTDRPALPPRPTLTGGLRSNSGGIAE